MKKFINSFFGLLGKTVADVVIGVIAIAGILWLFMEHPNVIKTMMDMNLRIIEWATGLLKGNLGPQSETLFRVALAGDRMLLMLEAMLLIKVATFVSKWSCKCGYKVCCNFIKKKKSFIKTDNAVYKDKKAIA